jgi:ankyrin repeat protein
MKILVGPSDEEADDVLSKMTPNEALLKSIENGYSKGFYDAINKGANINSRYRYHGRGYCTPLILAVSYNQIEFVKYLVDHDVDVNVPNIIGVNAIILSVIKGNLEIVKYLVEHGADLFYKDHDGHNALAIASNELKYDIVEYLLGVMRNK